MTSLNLLFFYCSDNKIKQYKNMKNSLKKIAFITVCTMTLSLTTLAQDTGIEKAKSEKYNSAARFNDEQKALVKANMEQKKAAKQEFRATFTDEQKNIMADKSLTREEKIKKLEPTLTAEQKLMWQKNKEQARDNRQALAKTLSPEQKLLLKKKSSEWIEKHKKMKAESKKDSLN
ncbi:MAG: hypothetical protein EAZ51_05330 [Sphingobacteriales bacterium]|nr:MAG: hypothetical protein EAZ64_06220 [Sphingobacteriales bacterium]TAF80798.1 MAG: hypothetical protein EAZ51_05330 [Sphingobacteriales bacterium]